MTLEEQSLRGRDAESLIKSSVWRMVWERLHDHVEQAALGADTRDGERAKDILRTKQLLRAIEREAHRIVQDGEAARIQLDEIAKQSRFKAFRR